MYDILGSEKQQGDEEASERESNSIRLHNDVHKVKGTPNVLNSLLLCHL
jgi:hypothetical protein